MVLFPPVWIIFEKLGNETPPYTDTEYVSTDAFTYISTDGDIYIATDQS